MRLTRIMLSISLACCLPATAQISFTMYTSSRGLGAFPIQPGMAHGVAAADYDNDGDIDILVPTADGFSPRLYRNDGSGTFTDVASSVGLTPKTNDRIALFVDYDGDRDLDIILANDHFMDDPNTPTTWPDTLRLFQQDGDGKFSEVTAQADVGGYMFSKEARDSVGEHIGGVNFGDFDGDGDLDAILGMWRQSRKILRNDADGTFRDVSDTSGIAFIEDDWQPHIQDFNDDGLMDILIAVDFTPNRLYLSNGDMTFTNAAAAWGLDNAYNDMGIACGDYDNDGGFDYYITNINDAVTGNTPWVSRHNVMLRDDGPAANPRFSEVSMQTNTAYADWAWGCDFADLDNDRDEDLLVTNGFNNPWAMNDRSRLFENLGAGPQWFSEAGQSAGFADTDYTSGLVTADVDRDGDLDVVQIAHTGEVRLFENTTPQTGSWVVVKPRRNDNLNHYSVGAVVIVEAGGVTMRRLITCSTSILSQKPYEAHFGLGASQVIDRIEVRWIDGQTSIIENDPRVNEILTIVPGVRLDAAADDVPFGGYRGRRLIDQDTREGYPDPE